MKNFKYIIFCIILFPLSVFASEEVIVKCPEHINKNEDFDCEIIGNAPYDVSAIEYEFKLPDYIIKKDFKVDPSWEGSEEDNLVLLYTDENKKSPFNIGIITLNSNKDIDNIAISTEYLLFGDEEYNEHNIVNKKDVKEMKSKEEKADKEQNNFIMYAIIILIIVTVLSVAFVIIKRRVII